MSKYLMNICNKCNTAIATNGSICNICVDEELKEFEKCKNNPYYFATTYLIIDNKPFTTMYTEQEFNYYFKNLKG